MEVNNLDIWQQKIQSDIDEIKINEKKQDEKIQELKKVTDFHERDIRDIKEDLKEIKDDTKWLRRSITNALIVGIIGEL
ncbi:hemolysin XhlA family protein [Cytobacillus horneckiae]|uniref:hemolysin XhlA family protein n=1 Tax=Cytobacillus horneckiae TaxID=549687 RepID=UPI0039A19A61